MHALDKERCQESRHTRYWIFRRAHNAIWLQKLSPHINDLSRLTRRLLGKSSSCCAFYLAWKRSGVMVSFISWAANMCKPYWQACQRTNRGETASNTPLISQHPQFQSLALSFALLLFFKNCKLKIHAGVGANNCFSKFKAATMAECKWPRSATETDSAGISSLALMSQPYHQT